MARREDTRPFSEKIAAELRAQIMSGEIPVRDPLPITADLVARYDVANTTIQKAVSILRGEGLVTSRQGKGVFVRDYKPFIVEASTYFEPSPGGFTYELLDVAEISPPKDVAEALQLPDGGLTVLRKRLMRHDDNPVELDHSYYPLDLVRGSDLTARRRIRGGAPRILEELGYPQRGFSDRVSARMPTTEEIEMLDIPEVPVMRQFRVVHSNDQKPVEVNVMIKGAHRYELVYRQDLDQL